MTFKYSIRTAVSGVTSHKSRSALTILGIVIGITAIILIVSIGAGAKNLILGEISGLGAETLVLRPGREPSGPTDLPQTLFADSIKARDAEALLRKDNTPHIASLMPVVVVSGSVSFAGETYRPQIMGGDAEFLAASFDVYPSVGALFGESEIRDRASVAIIGSKVKEELFGNADAVGESITVKDRKFKVIGVFPKKGQIAFLNIDDLVIVPYTTAQIYLAGIDHYNEIIIKAETPELVARTVRDVEFTIRELHGITDPDKDDFYVETQQNLVDQIQRILGILTTFLSLVVAIALVVGGIGVMNIMLVSVTERTREIGLRKAVGATNREILTQFLLEAIILTASGGVIGIILGGMFSLIASVILTQFLDLAWSFSFPISAAFLGLGVSSLVGLIFGIYPARQASKKSLIEALRYE